VNESKIELTERLRREGRWEEASRFKDEVLRKLRSNGMGKAESKEDAWAEMAKAYPPLPAPEGEAAPIANGAEPGPSRAPAASAGQTAAEESIDVDALLERIGDGRPSDLVQDTLWVYENLANRRVKASDAPSCGAWALLEWARQYRNRFFEQVLPKAMVNKPAEGEAHEREERLQIEEIDGILEKFNQAWEAELIADVPGTVREGVRSRLADWTRRFGLPLADDARASLEAHIAGFVQDCISAAGGTLGRGTAVASELPDG
jgi:hypothetical protein